MILSFERYTVNKHVTTDVLASPKRWKTTLEPVSERCTMSSCAASRFGDATYTPKISGVAIADW